MPVQFGDSLVTVATRWAAFKALAYNKNLPIQYEDDGAGYLTIFSIDDKIVYLCQIWYDDTKFPSPPDYTQQQNDADLTDFQTNYQASANAPLQPRASDGTPNHLPNVFPNKVLMFIPGAGDDSTNGIGAGTPFQHSSDDAGATSHVHEWKFNDWVYLVGGHVAYAGAVLGDTIDYYIYAPATVVTSTPGTGNCNIAGNVLLVPAQNSDGSSTVDLTQAIPVPNLSGAGHYDWTPPANGVGKGTLTPNYSGKGYYDLYTIQLTLSRFVVKVPMLGNAAVDFTVPAIIPKKCLPQWTHRVVVNNSGHSGLQVIWSLVGGRMKTT